MRRIMLFIAVLLLANAAMAQDILVKRNGEQMKVKILKITKKSVQFVRHGTELPVYKLPVSDIDYIEYPMGDRDTFSHNAKAQKTTTSPAKTDKWHGSVPPPKGSSIALQPVEKHNAESSKEKIYSIGEIYDKDGVKGIVAVLYDGGRHGVVMSLDEACLSWNTLSRKKQKIVGATDHYDGMANMQAVEKFIAKNGMSWSDFPAFEWCRNKGEGWYLPSINEIWSAGTMYMGGSRNMANRRHRKNYNTNLEMAGGKVINNLMYYYSSTEDKDKRYALYSHMNSEPPYTNSEYKGEELFVRAFHKF